jgi:hypothetical protein
MHNYGKLILKQRRLLALIHHCSDYKGEEANRIVREEYEKLHKLLDEEESNLRSKGLNPCDYHPMPTYARETREEQYEDNERDLNKLLKRG